MLTSNKVIGFLVTRDYDKARSFYEKKLGLEFLNLDQFALVMRSGPTMIRIVKLKDFTPAQNTVLAWEVEDIEKIVAWLTKQGVSLEDYPFIQDRKTLIWAAPGGSKVAWFKDPDGNVLSVSQHTD